MQRRRQAHRNIRIPIVNRPTQRGTQIVVFLTLPSDALIRPNTRPIHLGARLDLLQKPVTMLAAQFLDLAGLLEALNRELPDRLEQAKANRTAAVITQYQRLVDKLAQQFQHIVPVYSGACANRLCGLECPATAEEIVRDRASGRMI